MLLQLLRSRRGVSASGADMQITLGFEAYDAEHIPEAMHRRSHQEVQVAVPQSDWIWGSHTDKERNKSE